MDFFNLEDESLFKTLDKSNMLRAIYNLPDQMEEAVFFTRAANVRLDKSQIKQVVVTGLGGSAVGGDLLRSYAGDKCSVPIVVNRGYSLPAFVGSGSLVVAVSYSGNTEETLSAYHDARRRGAQIIAITSGGELKQQAIRDGVKVVTVPSGLQPRAATGYLFIPQLLILSDAGLLPSVDQELGETLKLLRKMREDLAPGTAADRNLAKRLAKKLHGRIPVIHSAVGLTEILGYRWKTQINENAQSLAFAHHYPELNHNEIVGFDVPHELVAKLDVITLISSKNHPQIQKRMEITTRELTSSSGCRNIDVYAQGDSDLAQMFSLLYIGDWVSSYLAVAYGLDPTPVDKIQLLKKMLAE